MWYCLHSCHVTSFLMHKTILLHFRCISVICTWLTSKQNHAGYFFFFFSSLIVEEVSAGSLPLHHSENHPSSEQPMAADLRPSPKHYLNSLLQAQTFLNRHFGNAASCGVLLQLPTDLPWGWHADSTTEIKTAPQGEKKKSKKKSPHSFNVLLHAPLRQQIPCSVPSCTIRTAAQQSWCDYKVLRNMQ